MIVLIICVFGNICFIVSIKGVIFNLFFELIGIFFFIIFFIVKVVNLFEQFDVMMR